jgi:hypothetical protein
MIRFSASPLKTSFIGVDCFSLPSARFGFDYVALVDCELKAVMCRDSRRRGLNVLLDLEPTHEISLAY